MKKTLPAVVVMIAVLALCPSAHAATRVYISLGVPSICIGACGAGPCESCVWVEGCYRWEGPRYVWVPGHWEPVAPLGWHRAFRPPIVYRERTTYIYNNYYRDNDGGRPRHHHRPGSSGGDPRWERTGENDRSGAWKAHPVSPAYRW